MKNWRLKWLWKLFDVRLALIKKTHLKLFGMMYDGITINSWLCKMAS